ncbi:hypothetical protein QZJ86_12040 [Methylomonas montana]|uniref:virion core protein, T7 gp14 family n=1 Tax=Methylomonas montana TaxID=3058963 RepID=UPI00265971EB|nr:hypothetical protein [Methylomonas montana]WKJ88752.1 hypothetical protein QZJ86_12040 [Methylomonas montana]
MPFAFVAAAAAVIGAGLSAYSASEQASAQKKAANYQAQVEANNAKIAGYQRSAALQQGEEQAQQSMMEQSQLRAKQIASMAANGVDLNSGSATDILATTDFLGKQDVNAIQNNAARKAWGYQVESGNYDAQSNLSKWKADNTNPAKIGAITGASSLLSSASTYAGAKAGR